jgi:flagellar biosynthetic protein FliR
VELQLPLIFGFTLVLFRTAGLVQTAPVLSSRSIPQRVKLALIFFVTIVAYFAAGLPRVEVPGNFGELAGLVISETVLGLAAGLSSRLLLDAAQYGGQAASTAMGFGFGQTINPNSGTESTTVGELVGLLALSVAIGLNLHREAIAWLVHSVQQVPPGATIDVQSLASGLVRQIIFALTLSIRVAYPIFAAAIFGYGTLAAMGKASPQLSLSNIGFGVSIAAGGGALYLYAPQGAQMCAQAALQVFSRG